MTDLTFYTHPQSRGRVIRWMLEEVGEPYETVRARLRARAMKGADYLAVNPMGKVPAIRHGDTVVTETAAICAYLADAFPDAGLAPPPGHRKRGPYYRWLFFAAGPVEAAVTNKALKVEVERRAARLRRLWQLRRGDRRARASRSSPAPIFAATSSPPPTSMSASQIGWGMMFGSIEKRPIFEEYFGRLQARPAAIRAREIDDALIAEQAQGRLSMSDEIERAAIALYDRFTHEGMDRRAFMAELTRIAGGAAAASAAARQHRRQRRGRAAGRRRRPAHPHPASSNGSRARAAAIRGYNAAPARRRGANCRWSSSSTRIAASTTISATSPGGSRVAGYSAVAPDFLSPAGGTPAGDEDRARTMIGALDMAETVADGAATIRWLASPRGRRAQGRHGRLLLGRRDGQPARGRRGRRAQGRRLLLRPGARSGRGGAGPGGDADPPRRPRRAGQRDRPALGGGAARGRQGRSTLTNYPNVDHAFHNDTSAARYNREAAEAGLGGDARFLPPAPALTAKKKARRCRRALPVSDFSTMPSRGCRGSAAGTGTC